MCECFMSISTGQHHETQTKCLELTKRGNWKNLSRVFRTPPQAKLTTGHPIPFNANGAFAMDFLSASKIQLCPIDKINTICFPTFLIAPAVVVAKCVLFWISQHIWVRVQDPCFTASSRPSDSWTRKPPHEAPTFCQALSSKQSFLILLSSDACNHFRLP